MSGFDGYNPTTLIGKSLLHYEITAKLGEGGMGEVYRAEDTKLGREVAIKVLPAAFTEDEERLARFEREAKLLAQLQHPHIASIYGLEESGEQPALVMELVEGPTLDERLAQGELSLEETLPVALQIAEALEAAHEKGIIHRDLKPQNVKLTPGGQVKVLDFGLAKAMDPTAAASGPEGATELAASPTLTLGHTVQGVILGTAAYMSPEQAAGGVADRRADIWSFGVVLYEMLTGQRLFEGETVSHVLAGVLKEDPDYSRLPAEVPPRIRRLLERCLRKKPKHRLQAMGDARVVIDEVLSGVVDEPAPASGSAVAPERRSIWPWALAVVAAFAMGAVVATLIAGRPTPPPSTSRTLSEIPLPAGQIVPTLGAEAALSPDGSRLAFVLLDEETRHRRLWVRQLSTGDQRPLPGTEDARSPFWSPDGRSLGFRNGALDQIQRVDLEGGKPVPLAKALTSCGASWGLDRIVFCSQWGEPLLRVAPTGGEVRPVIELDARDRALLPVFLPDGERFLYLRRGSDRTFTLVLTSVAGDDSRPLLASDSRGVVVDRFLYYMRGATLLARPFDAAAGKLAEGEPSIVAEGIARGDFTVAPGMVILGGQGRGGNSRITVYDRSGRVVDAIDSDTNLDDLVLSSDGRSAAVMKVDEAGDGSVDVYMIDLARKVFNRVTYGRADDDPVFSPDGETIAFARDGDLYLQPANGSGEPKLLVASDADIVTQDWAADGWIVYSDVGGEGEDLFAVRADGGEPRRLTSTPYRETLAEVSRDSRWLAYTSDESGEEQVYVTTWPDLSGKWRASTERAGMPRWGRGGSELYFVSSESQVMRATISATSGSPEIGLAEALFSTRYDGNTGSRTSRWAVSADGERFYVLEPAPLEEQHRRGLVLISDPLEGLK